MSATVMPTRRVSPARASCAVASDPVAMASAIAPVAIVRGSRFKCSDIDVTMRSSSQKYCAEIVLGIELLAKLPARPVFCLVEADFVVEGLGFGAISWYVVFLQ